MTGRGTDDTGAEDAPTEPTGTPRPTSDSSEVAETTGGTSEVPGAHDDGAPADVESSTNTDDDLVIDDLVTDTPDRSGRVTIVDPSAPPPPATSPEPGGRSGAEPPRLPGHTEMPPPMPAPQPTAPRSTAVPSASAYRSTDDRNRRVYRRANPWYRRLARGVVAVVLLGCLGVAVYVGARAIQDFVDRDQLPPPGPDVPAIRETAILIASTSPALPLQGTLSFDVTSGGFEFIGLAGSPNANDRLVSPDGELVYIVNDNATWRVADGDDIVESVEHAIAVLSDDTTADAILTNRMRSGYVELVDETEEGPEADELIRYDLALDLTGFAESYPLQWANFQEDAIPGVQESRRHEMAIWLDDESILVRVEDDETGWNWERLAYSDEEFIPFRPPPTQIIDPETQETATGIDCQIDALAIGWTTTLPTCEESESVGRQLATSVGLADGPETPAAELAFASVCSALQGDEPRTFEDDAYSELAGLLVDTGVCPGDTSLLQPAG